MPELRLSQNALQRFNQIVPASSLGSALFSKFLHHIDAPLMRLSNERISIPQLVAGLPCVRLITTGAKSGAERVTPTIGVPDGENIALICSNWGQKHHPAWYYNLKANPRAQMSFRDTAGNTHSAEYRGQEIIDEAEYQRLWRKASEVYIGYEKYRVRAGSRQIPIMLMSPD